MERLLTEAGKWEHRHPGAESITGRRVLPLPVPPR
jgi:hypothetical protein